MQKKIELKIAVGYDEHGHLHVSSKTMKRVKSDPVTIEELQGLNEGFDMCINQVYDMLEEEFDIEKFVKERWIREGEMQKIPNNA